MQRILVPVVIAVVVLAGAAFAAAQMLTSSFSEGGSISGTVREVVVRSDRGDVTLTSGARTEFDFESRYLLQRPKFEKHLVGGVLTIESSCKGVWLRCDVELAVTVPAGVKQTIEAGSGKVSIHTR